MAIQKPVNNKANRQNLLKQEIKKIVKQEDLTNCRAMVEAFCNELHISEQDCAAALMLLQQPDQKRKMKLAAELQQAKSLLEIKMVRYRLDVGLKDRISVAAVKQIMVDEAGLELSLIGYIDIQNLHTVINLPEGMPAEIFQLLKEVEINQKVLNITRLGGKNRSSARGNKFQRNKRRKYRSGNMAKKQTEKKPDQTNKMQAENNDRNEGNRG